MNGISRFASGFRSGYRKQRAIDIAHHPQVKNRTALFVISGVVVILAILTYWLMSLPEGQGDAAAESLGNAIGSYGKLLIALAMVGSALLFSRRRR